MGKADHLSRRADHNEGENDNQDVTILPPRLFANAINLEALDEGFMRRIKQSRNNKDRVVIKALEEGNPDWEEDNGIVTFKERIYVPRNKKLREDIIRNHHDPPVTGHPGQQSTRELIT